MKITLKSIFILCAVSECFCINPGTTACKNILGTVQRVYDNMNISVSGKTVNISCINDSTLIGNENVTCLQNGSWHPPFPRCFVNCPAIPELPLILSKDTVTYVKTDTKQRYAGITISLSCVTQDYVVDGSSTITCQSTRKWNPDIPSCKPKPKPPDRRWLLILAISGISVLLLVIGFIMIGKILLRWREHKDERKEVMQMSSMLNTDNFYKVWTVSRGRKKLISATDIKNLIQKASTVFDIDESHAQLVLEEDGTEVTTSTAMALSHDKTLTILEKDQSWKPVTATENEKLKLTFDVCSADRSKRKLFLAATLDELLEQVEVSFGKEQGCLCLEEDGTIIDDNSSLFAIAGQLIMSIRSTNDWRKGSDSVVQQPDEINTSQTDRRGPSNCYKVWTEDHRLKKIIFANDLLDLHIKAARILSLASPIEIYVLGTNKTVITDNEQLHQHQTNILVAMEACDIDVSAPASIYSGLEEQYSNKYIEFPDVLNHKSSRGYHNRTYF